MVISEFDSLDRLIREIRKSTPDDSNPRISEYHYDENGNSLVHNSVMGDTNIVINNSVKSFFEEEIIDEIDLNYLSILINVQRLVNRNINHIKSENWIYWNYTCVTNSGNQKLTILRRKIHNEKSAKFVTKTIYD